VALLHILLLEDSLLDTELIQATLTSGGINGELVRVETRTTFQAALETDFFDLILSDYSLPSFDGISALELAQAICPEVPFIFVSATLGEELAIETLKNGATDYVLKQRLERLVPAVKRALREQQERSKRRRAEAQLRTLAAELERRVKERTAELARANESLKEEIAERKRVEESLRRSESTLRSYFELPLIGIAISSPEKGWLTVNDKVCDILGYDRGELTQMTWVDITHPEDVEPDLEQFNRLMRGETDGYLLDKRFIRKNGEVIDASISVRGVRRGDGSIDYLVTLVQDITDRKQAEEERVKLIQEQTARREAEAQALKSNFLAQASTELASSLDYEATLARVAKLAIPFIADWCAVDILEENQAVRRVAIAHLDPAKVELAWELWRDYPEDLTTPRGVAQALRTGEAIVVPDITDANLSAFARDAKHLEMLRTIGMKSYLAVPMRVRGRILGSITFLMAESSHRYGAADLPLVEDLAHRAALAIDNARLYRETQQARRIAEKTAERNASLQTLTAALSEALTPAQVGEVVVNEGLAALQASAGFIALLSDNHTSLEVVRALGYPPEILDTGTLYPLTASVPITDAVRSGELLAIESREAWAERYPHLPTKYNHHAWADMPLIVEGRTLGGMGFSFPKPQTFSEDDRAFMLAMARQCAQAIERTRAYAAEKQARAEAEAANRTKDEFLATLSHELRTPLNAMLGWTQLLQTRSLDQAKMDRALETIDRNTRSLAALIEDILDVSRIMTGKLYLSPRPCELVGGIEAAIEAVRPAAEAKMIQIEYCLDSSAGPVWGDANRLQQVVWNLLSNAIKFTPSGGHVLVKLEKVDKQLNVEGLNVDGDGSNVALGDASSTVYAPLSISNQPPNLQPSNSYAQIQVSDTGKGISPDFLPYVFERFRQENGSITRAYGGLGLGLAIVRYLVELHGGTVQATSPGEGLGATFTVQLPLLLESRESGVGSRNTTSHRSQFSTAIGGYKIYPDSPLQGLQLLIVDDEADARELLVTILEDSGAQVTAVASASEALNWLSTSKADILVSDIGMPQVDGYTLIRQIRELEAQRGEYIPAVALTAYARESDRSAALEAGFQIHFAKPFDPDELVRAVAKLASYKPKSLRE
jgi:PAS domain S-box-containing protein